LLEAEIYIFLIIAGVGLSFFMAEKILSDAKNKPGQETSVAIRESGVDNNSRVKDINARLAAVAQIQAEFVPYSRYVEDITNLIPAGVILSRLYINDSSKTVGMIGLALKQSDLQRLKKNLKEAPFLTDVNIPVQQEIKKDNIEIDIQMKFDPTKLPSF